MDVAWAAEGIDFRRLELWGDGVGIEQGRRQFRLGKDETLSVLKAFLLAEIDDLETLTGGGEDDLAPRIRFRARIAFTAKEPIEKTVIRTITQPREERLERLVSEIRAICAAPMRSGVEAASLPDALTKLAKGILAPQALTLRFDQRDEKVDASGARHGWTLHLRGLAVELTRHGGAGEDPPRRRLRLSSSDFTALVKQLRKAKIETYPGVLFSERYEQLSVDALSHVKDFQARSFVGVTRASHPSAQKSYERLRPHIEALEKRIGASSR
jgi:hypothetical protein